MTTDPRRTFAKRLREFIREDQRGFCREHGFDETRLSKQLSAESLNPTLETIWRFAQALEVDPADLISEREVGNSVASESAPIYDVEPPPELAGVTNELRGIRLELKRIRTVLEGRNR